MSIRNQARFRLKPTGLTDRTFANVQMNSNRRSSSPADRVKSFNSIAGRLVRCLTQIIQSFDCETSPLYFPHALLLLESLPLTTAEYDLAQHRLENARRYAASHEAGAAIYELRILLARLRTAS